MIVTTIRNEVIDLVPGMTLHGGMLRDLNLDGVNLRGSSLRGCFFNQSSLVGADLSECDLTDAVFYRANLSGADLTGSTVAGCYWVETAHSLSTKWPDTTTVPSATDLLAETEMNAHMSRWRGGLCDPGATNPARFEGTTVPFRNFAMGLKPGPVSPEVSERLFTRLALNLYRASELAADEEQSFLAPSLDDDWFTEMEIDPGLFGFTAAVLLLAALGLRFERVIDEDTVSVSLHPQPDMRKFAEHDAVRLFRYLLEVEAGREVDPESTVRGAMDAPWEFESILQFASEENSHSDVSAMLDNENPEVCEVEGPAPAGSAEDTVLRTIYEFCHFVILSQFVCEVDDESVGQADDSHDDDEDPDEEFEEDDDDLDDDEDPEFTPVASSPGWSCEQEALMYRVLGIVSVSWTSDGFARAEMKPPMDIEALVASVLLDQRDRTLESLGLAGAQPDLGAFAWLAS